MNQRMYQLGSKRSVIREIFEFGKQRAAQVGAENVFDFSLGNPSVQPPQIVEDTLISLLKEEDATALHGYTSAQGDAGVRAAIARYIRETHGVKCEADWLYMTCGAAASLTITLSALCNAGDEVITFAPYFTEYKVFAETAGAKLVALASDPDTFQIDFSLLEGAINEKRRQFSSIRPTIRAASCTTNRRSSALQNCSRSAPRNTESPSTSSPTSRTVSSSTAA